MHINNLPTEIFIQILEKTSFEDIGKVMRVNKRWYRESRAMVQKCDHAIFEILLTTNYDTNYILIDVLRSFCINFNLDLEKKLWELHDYLRDQREKIKKEEAVIDNLLSHYKAESHFKGSFPDWLVEKHKKFIHKLIAIAHVTDRRNAKISGNHVIAYYAV